MPSASSRRCSRPRISDAAPERPFAMSEKDLRSGMRQSVRMPQFGESAAEATVVAWLVKPGDEVAADQEIVEVQTEKSLLTVSAPAAGVLAEQCAEPGKKLAVGEVLAYIELANGASPS